MPVCIVFFVVELPYQLKIIILYKENLVLLFKIQELADRTRYSDKLQTTRYDKVNFLHSFCPIVI